MNLDGKIVDLTKTIALLKNESEIETKKIEEKAYRNVNKKEFLSEKLCTYVRY